MTYPFPHYSFTESDLQPGTLFHLKNPEMKKKNGQLPFHFHLLLKSTPDGKYHLLIPTTSTGQMHNQWSVQDDSSSFYLPSPYHMGKKSSLSPNLMKWFSTEELMTLQDLQMMYFLDEMTPEWMESFGEYFMYDLYENLPTLPYELYWYSKFQKTWESDSPLDHGWTHKKWWNNHFQWKTYGTFKKY